MCLVPSIKSISCVPNSQKQKEEFFQNLTCLLTSRKNFPSFWQHYLLKLPTPILKVFRESHIKEREIQNKVILIENRHKNRKSACFAKFTIVDDILAKPFVEGIIAKPFYALLAGQKKIKLSFKNVEKRLNWLKTQEM